MATRPLTRSCLQLSTSQSTSAAHSFMNLFPCTIYTTFPPVLDFLLPQSAQKWNQRTLSSRVKLQTSNHRNIRQATRSFTSSAARRATVAIYNPQKDDDGNAMGVQITPRASNVHLTLSNLRSPCTNTTLQRLKQIMNKDSNPNFALRIQVESGGCHGFQYLISPVTLPPLSQTPEIKEESAPALNTSSTDPNAMPSRSSSNEDIMEEAPPALNTSSSDPNAMPSTDQKSKSQEGAIEIGEEDVVFMTDDGSEAKVVMDTASLDLLNGSKVDFTNELIGSQFKIDNPLATSSCGCGTSFDIK
jgi:Fe-S cluster assembly iron-binding protein IscA